MATTFHVIFCLAATFIAHAEPATNVELVRLDEIAVYPRRSAPARVVSLNDTPISAEIAARVVELPVRVGDVVEAGGLLVALDCQDYELIEREYKARLEAVEARIDLAHKRLRRTKQLITKKTVAEELLDERESELAVLRADRRATITTLERSNVDVSRCAVTSPFRALIVERLSAVGQYANVGTSLVHVMELDALEVSAQIFNRDVEQLQQAEMLEFENADQRYALKLRTILPSINTRTRNREVRLLFLNGPALPGAAGKILWTDPRMHLPGRLLVKRGDVLGFFVAQSAIARFIAVADAEVGRATPVHMSADTLVIVDRYLGLSDGAPITISPAP